VEGSGHHHIVVDGKASFVKPGEAIPFDATHLHFGKVRVIHTVRSIVV
jgi:hypothetical protein